MSDTSRLGISITASDTATASIKQLESTVRGLQQTLRDIGGTAADAGGKITAALNAEITSIQREISARTGQATAIKTVTTAIKEQTAAAEVLHRTLQQGINASLGIGADRQIKSASESARVLATSLSAAAEADARLRDVAASTAVALDAQAAASRTAGRAAVAGGEGAGVGALLQRESRHIVGLFDSLARGQRGQAISSIGAAARDAGLGVGALSASIGGLVALMGSEALLRGAERMGRWAAETRAAASAAGMSIESYSALQGAFTLMGMKAGEADTTLRRLSVNLSSALADKASLAAQAFHNLGISQEQLQKTGGDVGEALKLLAAAFTNTADGANKSANMNEIFGRGFERIIPLLQKGSAGLEELEVQAKKLGFTLTEDTAKGLEKTGEQATSLGAAVQGSAIKAFEDWQPVIRVVIELLKELSAELGIIAGGFGKLASGAMTLMQGALKSPFESYPEHVKRMMALLHPNAAPGGGSGGVLPEGGETAAGAAAAGAKLAVPALVKGGSETILEKMRHDATQAAEIASRSAKTAQAAREAEGKAEIAVMQKVLQEATLTAKQREAIEQDIAQKQISLRNAYLSESVAAGNRAAKQSYADFAAAERLKIAEADGSASKIAAIYDEWLSAVESRYKQHANVIANIEREKVQAVNSARLKEIVEGARQAEQQSRLATLDAQLAQVTSGKFAFGSGSNTSVAQLQAQSQQYMQQAAAVKSAADTEIAALTQVRDTAEEGSATQKKASQEIMNVLIQSKTQELELYKKAGEAASEASKKAMEGFKKLFDSLGSAFETFSSSAVKALIAPQQELIKAGLTTIKHSMRGAELQQAFAQMATSMLQSLGKSVQEAIGGMIAKSLSGGAADTIGQLLTQTFSKIFGNIAGSAAGSAVGQAAGGAVGSTAVVGAIGTAATATTTGISTAVTAMGASVTSAIAAGSASTVGAITASAAAQEALLTSISVQQPSVLGFSLAGGGIIPSAQGGMVLGGGGTLAILHPKEMVLPAELSRGMQQMIRGNQSNSASLNYSPTINSNSRRGGYGMTRAEFSQMLSVHSGAMLGEARNMMRQGWRPA